MNRPNHIRKAKSLAQKYNARRSIDEEEYEEPVTQTEPTTKTNVSLFNKINMMFDDPSIKDLKEFDHDDFLNKGDIDDFESNLPQCEMKTKAKSLQAGKQILDKAKILLEKKSSEIPAAKEKQKLGKLAAQKKAAKENTFVTGIGMYSEKEEEEQKIVEKPKQDEEEEEEEEYEEFDENEYLKQLQDHEFDDLAELRKMIAKTKKEIQGYAGEVYNLKNSISDLNVGYRDIGYGVDEDLFCEMDRELNRFMPGGDTNKLFDDIGSKVKNSQAILSTAKKGVKKNTFMQPSSNVPSSSNGNYLSGSSSQTTGIRKPPIPTVTRQVAVERIYSSQTQRVGELQPISGNSKNIRQTFF